MRRLLSASFCVAIWIGIAHPAPVPSPESHFGHPMGADRKLLDWNRVVSYFEKLERSSDRIKLLDLGRTTEGREYIAAVIASSDTIKKLDHYRDIQARLADPRKTTPAEAEKLIARRQDGGADHLLDSSRRWPPPHRGRVCIPAADRGQAALPRDSAQHDSSSWCLR